MASKLWNIVEEWRDSLEFPPSYRQIALRLGVSQSTFETWKTEGAGREMPKRRNLLAISRLTGVPYRRVVDAAIEDVRLYDEAAAEAVMDKHTGSE